jgi:hypothetical protein
MMTREQALYRVYEVRTQLGPDEMHNWAHSLYIMSHGYDPNGSDNDWGFKLTKRHAPLIIRRHFSEPEKLVLDFQLPDELATTIHASAPTVEECFKRMSEEVTKLLTRINHSYTDSVPARLI